MTVHALLVALVRFALAAAGLAIAAALIGFAPAFRQLALGAVLLTLVLFFGRRHRLLEDAVQAAAELPAGAADDSLARAVGASLFPSTVGVAILAAASVVWDARLTGILSGLLAAMGFAYLVLGLRAAWWERTHHARLLYEAGPAGNLFVAER